MLVLTFSAMYSMASGSISAPRNSALARRMAHLSSNFGSWRSKAPAQVRREARRSSTDLIWEAVASDDDLFIELIEVVEDIEEFLLGFFLVDDKLEVVDDENVEFAEFEVEFFTFAEFDGIDEVGVEVGNRGVENF